MSQPFVDRLADSYKWFNEHRAEASDVAKRQAFLERVLVDLYDLLSFVAQDLQKLEGLPPEAIGRRLYLPQGMSYAGSLKRFG